MKSTRALGVALTLILVAFCAAIAGGADGTSTITGIVYRYNPEGPQPLPAPGLQVFVYSANTRWVGPSVTDSAGRFAFPRIPAGEYLLRVYVNKAVRYQETDTAGGPPRIIVLGDSGDDINSMGIALIGKDDRKANQYFAQAAEAGSTASQYNLGLSYELGRGIAQSTVQALKWYLISKTNEGAVAHSLANDRAEYLLSRLSTTDISTAETLANQWMAAHRTPVGQNAIK